MQKNNHLYSGTSLYGHKIPQLIPTAWQGIFGLAAWWKLGLQCNTNMDIKINQHIYIGLQHNGCCIWTVVKQSMLRSRTVNMYNYREQNNILIILMFCLHVINITLFLKQTMPLQVTPVIQQPRQLWSSWNSPNYFHTVKYLGHLVQLIRSPCCSGHFGYEVDLKLIVIVRFYR